MWFVLDQQTINDKSGLHLADTMTMPKCVQVTYAAAVRAGVQEEVVGMGM